MPAAPSPPPAGHDVLTLAFGEASSETYVLVRLAAAAAGAPPAGGLVLVLEGAQLRAQIPLPPLEASTGEWELPGVRVTGEAPGWRLELGGELPDSVELSLEFEALSADPARFAGSGEEPASAECPCRVRGVVAGTAVEGRGQLGRRHGPPPRGIWRELDAWPGDTLALCLRALGRRGKPHGEETVGAYVFDGEPLLPTAVWDPRLSTGYDRDLHPHRVGTELWLTEEAQYPRRLAGESRAVVRLDEDGRRRDIAFMRVRMDGADGVARYEVVREAG
jgi:hypothetical protein